MFFLWYIIIKEYADTMNNRIIVSIIAFLLITGVSFSGFAQTNDLNEIQAFANQFSEELAKTLPLNSSIGLNWSDAYIGKLFPSLPPHFGLGGSFGISAMNFEVIKALTGSFGYSVPFDIDKLYLPAYTVEARIGGIFLPFDAGFKLGYLPTVGLWSSNLHMNYLLVGGDLRFAILDLDKPIIPKISIGVGYNYLKGGIGGKGMDKTIDCGIENVQLSEPEVDLNWSTKTLDFKTQISMTLAILTPYIGVGGGYAWSSAGYSVKTGLPQADIDIIKGYISDIEVDDTGLESMIKNNAPHARVFGGLSINLMVFRIDFTALYSFLDKNFGGSLGLRFQL